MAKRTPQKNKAIRSVSFSIDGMDPLGQGVFRNEGAIGFIAKTLPQEAGTATVMKTSKGVSFARLTTLDSASEQRITPECRHFNECPGCHYLHTSYENELQYKQQALANLLKKLPLQQDIEVIAAPKRLHYRNRLQLHYRGEQLGLIDGLTDKVIEIPHCQILEEALEKPLADLYADKSWAKQQGKTGHCELYRKDDGVSVQWNQAYAHGGFTQVFDDMNDRLCQEVTQCLMQSQSATLLDLFSGNGNLSNAYCARDAVSRVMVDATPYAHPDFIELDLFADNALELFKKRSKTSHFTTLVLDPPRKGFPEIDAWIKHCKPKHMIYVSCNPATLARDLQGITSAFTMDKVQLLDLFPGTYHFETLVKLTFKKHGK